MSSLLFIITGSRGAGKTSFCRAVVAAARKAEWQVSGLLSNPEFEGEMRVRIEAEDLKSGQSQTLATRITESRPATNALLVTQNWQFQREALAWGNEVLQESTPADLLVVDELGMLEFDREMGWLNGFMALEEGQYRVALVVIRPEQLGNALLRWGEAHIIEIETPEDSQEKAKIFSKQLFA